MKKTFDLYRLYNIDVVLRYRLEDGSLEGFDSHPGLFDEFFLRPSSAHQVYGPEDFPDNSTAAADERSTELSENGNSAEIMPIEAPTAEQAGMSCEDYHQLLSSALSNQLMPDEAPSLDVTAAATSPCLPRPQAADHSQEDDRASPDSVDIKIEPGVVQDTPDIPQFFSKAPKPKWS